MARLLFLTILFHPAMLRAAQPEPINLFASGVKLFIGLAVVVAAMLLFHVVNRKGFKFLESRHTGMIRILETRAMGARKSLCLVEVEGERILLGLGSDRVDLLHRFGAERGAGRFEEELSSQEASLG
jgi:flagellar biogenesis protein FliO